jgi:hypothetical protein
MLILMSTVPLALISLAGIAVGSRNKCKHVSKLNYDYKPGVFAVKPDLLMAHGQ